MWGPEQGEPAGDNSDTWWLLGAGPGLKRQPHLAHTCTHRISHISHTHTHVRARPVTCEGLSGHPHCRGEEAETQGQSEEPTLVSAQLSRTEHGRQGSHRPVMWGLVPGVGPGSCPWPASEKEGGAEAWASLGP